MSQKRWLDQGKPIIEGDEPGPDNDIVQEEEEVDPDNATPNVMADGWEEPNPNNDDEATGEDSENPIGIAFTLYRSHYKHNVLYLQV
ncbi:hypothetical protein MJO29_002360 [Puccinia striiformis f. sp. tritici]|nr:hypothetical protein MJO29_002360 [Puccinia striiformis f. sp. tritici]KAI9609940.1 hypothetical protein H4Q26_006931 [Puccinia striiformis f. sp. tritici PST-130]